MQKLPITVLFHEGPIGRAYLSQLYYAGYKVDEIINVIYTKHPFTKKRIGRWMPKPIKILYLQKLQELLLSYWPKKLKSDHPNMFKIMTETLNQSYSSAKNTIEDIVNTKELKTYSDNVINTLASGINDKTIEKSLENTKNETILFTGGGILKKGILGISNKRLLHIHPGYLPHIRGADGLLWSTLIRKRPGASAFFMQRKIDTGNVIHKKEFQHIKFPIPEKIKPDDKTLYRALFAYYDPLIRSELLMELVWKNHKLEALPETEQDTNEGGTYTFMDEDMLKKSLNILFPSI